MTGNARTLVVLGASTDQLFLIETAQALGLRVLAVDRDADAPGFAVAEESALISTRDVAGICAHLDRLEKDEGAVFAGVTTMGSDIPEIVAAIAGHLGTPSIPLEAARLTVDKFAMKVRLRECSIPIPWFREVPGVEDLLEVIADRGLPLVIKPIDRSGSRGVFFLRPGCDPTDLFQKAKAFSFSGRVQVEEYLPGPQISTETILYGGRAVTPGFADRNYDTFERFLPQIMENGGWVPSLLSAEERKQVEELVVSASLALGISEGVTKGDVVMTPEGPRIIEIAARLSGGDFCAGLVPLGSGVNYVRTAIQIAIGETPDLDALAPRFERAVANRYFFPEPGRLVRIEGVEAIRARPWLHKLEFWYRPGEIVPESLSHAHRFGVFVVSAPDRATAQARVDEVYDTIRIVTRPEKAASRTRPESSFPPDRPSAVATRPGAIASGTRG